jgi:hypothetical protein
MRMSMKTSRIRVLIVTACMLIFGSALAAGVAAYAATASPARSVVQTGDLSAELTLGGVCLAIPSMTAADGSQLVTVRCSAMDPRAHWHIW